MHGRRVCAVVAVVGLAACGAKTGLDVAGPSPTDASVADASIDAGVAMDATPPPPPEPDAALPEPDACVELRMRWGGRSSVTPTVVAIVDASMSMGSRAFGSPRSRWSVVRTALIGRPDGLILELAGSFQFGLALYSGGRWEGDDGPRPGEVCPAMGIVSPAVGNYDRIRRLYVTTDLGLGTPTGDAIDAVVESLEGVVDPSRTTTVFILATDGEPFGCESPDPERGRATAVAAMERAFAAGIRGFVISVAEGDIPVDHLQDMANAGAGRRPGAPDARFWDVDELGDLERALAEIVSDRLSCTLPLERPVDPSRACEGRVRLGGRTLPCDDDDGWRAVDERHIELVGAACDELQASTDPRIDATFPCSALL